MVSNAVVEGVAGAVGGIAALVTTYPLMTISTLQATRRRKVSEGDEEEPLVVPVKRQTSTIADFAQVISTSGYVGLYQGIEPALLGTAVSQGVYFYLYSKLREAAQRILEKAGRAESGDIGVGPSLLVAFLAGCGNVLLTNPIWVVSTRMQAHQKGASGSDEGKLAHRPLAVAREIVRESGILGLWKGVLPSLVMVSNPTVNYVLYEWLLARLAELRQRRAADKRLAPASGATALEIFLYAEYGRQKGCWASMLA
ncbi:hypothetical protein WJX73_010625 [Symbiochloris irregularis]|uniref:Uncharacterized protein n=1 Tax=Symbiochloris irregularis TaxID=706552 RepID=A0AAW1PGF4_9CHLO